MTALSLPLGICCKKG